MTKKSIESFFFITFPLPFIPYPKPFLALATEDTILKL